VKKCFAVRPEIPLNRKEAVSDEKREQFLQGLNGWRVFQPAIQKGFRLSQGMAERNARHPVNFWDSLVC
jgi:hypothetical protein